MPVYTVRYRSVRFRVRSCPGPYGTMRHQVTARGHTFRLDTGGNWPPTGRAIAGHLAVYARYIYVDGDPSHGYEPYQHSDALHCGHEPFCGAIGLDPDSEEAGIAYEHWRAMADLAVVVLGKDLYWATAI